SWGLICLAHPSFRVSLVWFSRLSGSVLFCSDRSGLLSFRMTGSSWQVFRKLGLTLSSGSLFLYSGYFSSFVCGSGLIYPVS
ncbi:6062_t:CDS:2, partial [Gigaspora rosea]